MGQLKPPSQKAAAKAEAAAPATAKVPAPAPAPKAAGAAPPPPVRKVAPAQPAAAPPQPVGAGEDMFAGSSITLEPDEAEVQARTREKISTWLGSTPEERGAILREREKATLAPYLDRLARRRETRGQGSTGYVKGAGRGGGRDIVVYPDYANVKAPSRWELSTPIEGARAAKQLADQYRGAVVDYERSRLETEAQKADPYTNRGNLKPYAADSRAKLQRVADLKASLREYGWTDEDLKTLE